MKKYTLFFCCILNLCVLAQQWSWDSIVSSNSSLKIVKNHNDDVFTFENRGVELKKYDVSGKLTWMKSFNGALFNVSTDIVDNVYIIGTFTNTMVFDSFSLTSKGEEDIFILKLNPTGNAIWMKQIGSISRDVAGDININDSKIFVTGATHDTTLFGQIVYPKTADLDMFIARFDLNGNIQQVKIAGQLQADPYTASIGQEIKNDALGNIIVLATICGMITIDTSIINDYYATYVLKLDTSLNIVWKKFVMSGLGTGAGNLRINSIGEIFLIDLYDGHYVETGRLRKISANGLVIQTLFTVSSGFLYGMDIDSLSNVYFTGMRYKSTFNGNSPPKWYFEIGKLSTVGSLIWLMQDSSLSPRAGHSIASLSNNSCYVSGMFHDKIVLKDTLIGILGVNNYFLAILDANVFTLVKELNSEQDIMIIYPIPSSGIFNVKLNNETLNSTICVYDLLGNCLLKKDCRNDASQNIDLSYQPKGVYLIEIVGDGKRYLSKIILQ